MAHAAAGSTSVAAATRSTTVIRRALAAAGLLVLALGVVLAVPYLAMRVGLAAENRFRDLDPDRVFVYLYAHHAVEAAAGLVLILLAGRPALTWIRSRGDVRVALKAIAAFTGVIAVLAVILNDLPELLGAPSPASPYPLVSRNVIGILLFQGVVVGFGEELLFRGAVLGLLHRALSRQVRLLFFRVSVAGVVTAALFGLAHAVYFDLAFWPITFSPNWLQVGYAFALGVYYAAVTERSGSLWAAIVSHNIIDVLYVLALWWAVTAGK